MFSLFYFQVVDANLNSNFVCNCELYSRGLGGQNPNDQRLISSLQFFRSQIDLFGYVSQIKILDYNNIEKTITLHETKDDVIITGKKVSNNSCNKRK